MIPRYLFWQALSTNLPPDLQPVDILDTRYKPMYGEKRVEVVPFAKKVIRIRFCTGVYVILQGCLPPKKYPWIPRYLKFGREGFAPPTAGMVFRPGDVSAACLATSAGNHRGRYHLMRTYLGHVAICIQYYHTLEQT